MYVMRRTTISTVLLLSVLGAASLHAQPKTRAEEIEPALVANVKEDAAAFIRTMLAMRGGYVREVPLPDDGVVLSYQVAQLFQGNADVQQKLLEMRTPERLSDELDLIKKATEQVKLRGQERHRRRFSPN